MYICIVTVQLITGIGNNKTETSLILTTWLIQNV